MRTCKYLIVGGGMAADAATKGIRKLDPEGTIVVISDEKDPPYDRPPLSKALWKGKPLARIWRNTAARGVELVLQRRAVKLDARERRVTDDRGEVYAYEKLLLATGGSPRRLAADGGRVMYYRTVEDYRRLEQLTHSHEPFAVIGGGFIGSELAAALAMNGKRVTLIFSEAGVGARMFPLALSRFLTDYYVEKGVQVQAGAAVARVEARNDACEVVLECGKRITAEGVIAGLGIMPNVELAVQAGAEEGNGLVVDEMLLTTLPNVYAAGDVANFFAPLMGKRVRVEHEDNANVMGEAAGENMAGAAAPYRHQPYFYSDLFDLGYEAIGETDSRHETIEVWDQPYRKGIIFYLQDRKPRGVVFWNVWDRVPAGRALLAEPGPFDRERLNAWAMNAMKS